MSNEKWTHTGHLCGCDARTPTGYRVKRRMRATKLHWVVELSGKYKLKTGRGLGDWPVYPVDIGSIRVIEAAA